MISRRDVLKAAVLSAVLYPLGAKRVFASLKPERSLDLYNIHTGESLEVTYYTSGKYDVEAVEQLRYALRCHHTNKVKEIDIRVLDLLSDIKDIIGKDRQLRIISGYRSPEYNDYLRGLGRGVVKDSLHLQGLAVDFAVDGISTNTLASVARSFASGGVGRYPEFVHVDVGRIRYW